MNITKIIYWGATALVALIYFGGGAFYVMQPDMAAAAYADLGYPTYIMSVMMVVKPLAALAILLRRPIWLSDLAYAGMFYHLILAVSAHVNVADGGYIPAVVGIVLLLVSFFTQNKARKGASTYALPA